MALRRIVIVFAALAVGAYYMWGVRAAGHPFEWGQDLTGYYDYLGRSFTQGKLSLPVEPAPELLAQPDPYDPHSDDTYKLWDTALFHRHYYLYHGAGPAVLLFAPWRLLTGHDLPENFALVLFCFGGYLFSCGTLLRVLSLAGAPAGPAMLMAMLPALGICQSIPYLLNRVWVYEIAIGGGYFCVSAAFFLLARGIGSKRSICWLAGSGLLFGLAVACRPTLALAAAIVLGAVAFGATGTNGRNWRELTAFAVPLAAAGAGIALYNYARFGNPFEFGIRYLLSGPFQNRIRLEGANIVPGFYYNLFCRPAFDAIFPWVRLAVRYPFDSASQLPKGYFLEPTAGALFLAPFIAGAFFVPRTTRSGLDTARSFLWIMTASGVAILLFLAATSFATQRYEVDFLPLLALAALANAGIYLSQSTARESGAWRRVALGIALAISIAFGAAVNLALGLTGPYDDVLKNRPASYARLARWFSPVIELRPIVNPRLNVEFYAEFAPEPEGVREPLLTIGRAPYSQFLYAEQQDGERRIVLKTAHSEATYKMSGPWAGPVRIGVAYDRASRQLVVAIDGREVLAADAGIIFTAPAQVTVGENRVDSGTTAARFAGRIRISMKTVQAD